MAQPTGLRCLARPARAAALGPPASGCGWTGVRGPSLGSDRGGDGLLEIGKDVVDVFDADGQAHHVLAHTGTREFLG